MTDRVSEVQINNQQGSAGLDGERASLYEGVPSLSSSATDSTSASAAVTNLEIVHGQPSTDTNGKALVTDGVSATVNNPSGDGQGGIQQPVNDERPPVGTDGTGVKTNTPNGAQGAEHVGGHRNPTSGLTPDTSGTRPPVKNEQPKTDSNGRPIMPPGMSPEKQEAWRQKWGR